ncbi:MAG TPA: RtcB family protein, partial [Nitrososphaerales archaeon]|nr:RtcB family protein [Nitrososphaerales archaeon]
MQKVGDVEYRIEKTAKPGMRVPVTIYANETLIAKMETDRTIDQAVNVAHLPGIEKHTVVLPDGHEGYGFPIGGVAATSFYEGVISPGGDGYDINCGVRLLRTNLRQAAARQKLSALVKEMYRTVPSGLGNVGALNLSIQQLDSVLAEGVKWAVNNGYGRAGDLEF